MEKKIGPVFQKAKCSPLADEESHSIRSLQNTLRKFLIGFYILLWLGRRETLQIYSLRYKNC